MATAPTTRINDLQTLLNHHADQGDISLVDRTINTESPADAAIGVFSGHKTVANVRLHTVIQELLEKEPDENTLEYKGQTMTAQAFKTVLQSQSADSLNINSIFTTYGACADRPQQSSQAEAASPPAMPQGTGARTPVDNIQTLLDYHADQGYDPHFLAGIDESEQCFVRSKTDEEYQAEIELNGLPLTILARNYSLYEAVKALLQLEPSDKMLQYQDWAMTVEVLRASLGNTNMLRWDMNQTFAELGVRVDKSSPAEATYRPVQALPPGGVSQLKLETLQTGVDSNIDSGSEGLNIPVSDLQALLNDYADDGHDPRFRAEFDYDAHQCYVQLKPKEEYQAQLDSIGLPTIKSIANNSLSLAVDALLQTEPDDKTLEYKGKEISAGNLKAIILAGQNCDINEIFTRYGEPLGESQQSSQAEEATSPPTKAPAQAQAQALPPGNAWLTALKETQEAQASRPGPPSLDASAENEEKKTSPSELKEKIKNIFQKDDRKKTSYGDLPSEIPKVGQTKSELSRMKDRAYLAVRHPREKAFNPEGVKAPVSTGRLGEDLNYQHSDDEIGNDIGIGDDDL